MKMMMKIQCKSVQFKVCSTPFKKVVLYTKQEQCALIYCKHVHYTRMYHNLIILIINEPCSPKILFFYQYSVLSYGTCISKLNQ